MATGEFKAVFRIIDKAILNQIEIAKKALEKDPRFDISRSSQILSELQKEASKHSVGLELPNGKKRNGGKARRAAEVCLTSALKHFKSGYDGNLTEQLIGDILHLIMPNSLPHAPYRNLMAFASGSGYAYTDPEKIRDEVLKFIKANNGLESLVERAVHAHFHVTRIHPFNDGNGRLARLTQNGILDYANLPPVIIELFERRNYLSLLYVASREYKKTNGKMGFEQANFYNYLATKLLCSLRETQKRINQQDEFSFRKLFKLSK